MKNLLINIYNFFKNTLWAKSLLFAILLLCIIVVFLMQVGWYPVAVVSWSPVFSYEYNEAFNLSYSYYKNLMQKNNIAQEDENDMKLKIKKIVLGGLIDNIIIEKKLEEYISESDLENEIDKNIRPILSDEKSLQILKEITKSSEDNIKKYFLEVESKSQILNEFLKKDGFTFGEWLSNEHRDISVFLFISGVSWSENGLIEK